MDQKLYLGIGLAVALALGVGGGVWALQGEKPEKGEHKPKIEAEKAPAEAVVVTPPPAPAPAGGGRIAVRYLDVPMEQISAFEAEHGFTLASEIPQLHVRVLAVPDIDAALALYKEHAELAKYAEKETGVTTN